MNTRRPFFYGALLFCALLVSAASPGGGEGDCVSAASRIAQSARESGVRTVSVLGFTAKGAAAPAVFPADLRDAPSSGKGELSCQDRKLRLTRLNAELVDEKASYWAARMREPGFSVGELTRNPGSEITDPETKVRFYKTLTTYHREGGPAPDPAKLPALMRLMKEEKSVADECGSGPLPGLPPARAGR